MVVRPSRAWNESWNGCRELSGHSVLSGRCGGHSVQAGRLERRMIGLLIRRFRVRSPDAPPDLTCHGAFTRPPRGPRKASVGPMWDRQYPMPRHQRGACGAPAATCSPRARRRAQARPITAQSGIARVRMLLPGGRLARRAWSDRLCAKAWNTIPAQLRPGDLRLLSRLMQFPSLRVSVSGDLDRGVPQESLNFLHLSARGERERRRAVAKVMQPDRRQSRPGRCQLKRRGDGRRGRG